MRAVATDRTHELPRLWVELAFGARNTSGALACLYASDAVAASLADRAISEAVFVVSGVTIELVGVPARALPEVFTAHFGAVLLINRIFAVAVIARRARETIGEAGEIRVKAVSTLHLVERT